MVFCRHKKLIFPAALVDRENPLCFTEVILREELRLGSAEGPCHPW